jgi:hypothetical protein
MIILFINNKVVACTRTQAIVLVLSMVSVVVLTRRRPQPVGMNARQEIIKSMKDKLAK